MRQSSAGSLDSIPGSETSSLSDHSRDLSRSEEESSVGKPSEPSPLTEKHDEIKDITSAKEGSGDVIVPSSEPEKGVLPRDLDKPEEKEDKLSEVEGDVTTEDRQEIIEHEEDEKGQKDDDKRPIEGKEETIEEEVATNDDNENISVENENTVFEVNDVKDVEESSQENLVKSSEKPSDDAIIQNDVKCTNEVALVEDNNVTRDVSSPDHDTETSDVADVTGFVHKAETDTDKYSSKFDDILDKLEESEDTENENKIVENEVEEKKSVENSKLHETITEHEKIVTNVKQDEGDEIAVNGEVTKKDTEEELKKEESRNNVEETEKDTSVENRNEDSNSSPVKQLSPSKFSLLRSRVFSRLSVVLINDLSLLKENNRYPMVLLINHLLLNR